MQHGRLQSLDWTGGLILKITFMLSKQTNLPVRCVSYIQETQPSPCTDPEQVTNKMM